MLIEFSVANYRSFRDLVTFSMVAAPLKSKYPELDQNNVFTAMGNLRLLTSAAVYGANASGKSNIISALAFMRRFVISSHRDTERTGNIPIEPFRLSTETRSEPSHFEVVFIEDGQRYRYGFEVTSERVEAEWLYTLPTIREAMLFERESDKVKLGERFRSEGKDLIDKTRPNALFLSVVAQFDGKVAQNVLSWFRSIGIATGLADTGMKLFTLDQLQDNERGNEVIAFIKKLDLGIQNLTTERVSRVPKPVPSNAPDPLRRVIESLEDLVKDTEQVNVRTVHLAVDQEGTVTGEDSFDLDEHESEGTQKLFALAGPLLDTLRNGEVLIVDEFDARLHPLLTREIVKTFNDRKTNPHHAQLIFITHDTNLLDNRILRRDQIWFVEKDRQGASDLYSLSSFKIRNDASFEKDYVQGRYGAVPFLGDLHKLIEEM